jgi:4'-phosphopantetheinyl transferase
VDLPFRYEVVRAADHPELERAEAPSLLLSPSEEALLAALRYPKRRHKWILGRIAAKSVLLKAIAEREGRARAARDVSVLNEPSGQPYAVLEGEGRLPWPLSISHRAEWGVAALGKESVRALGIDLETVETRSEDFMKDFFTPEESQEVEHAANRMLELSRIWSAKEAVLKALGVGLRIDTRTIRILPPDARVDAASAWAPFEVELSGITLPWPARGFFHRGPGYVLTAAVAEG